MRIDKIESALALLKSMLDKQGVQSKVLNEALVELKEKTPLEDQIESVKSIFELLKKRQYKNATDKLGIHIYCLENPNRPVEDEPAPAASHNLVAVRTITDISEGDTIIITGDVLQNMSYRVKQVKVSENDGTEIIFDMKNNRFFNLGMFLEGRSWVKQLSILK